MILEQSALHWYLPKSNDNMSKFRKRIKLYIESYGNAIVGLIIPYSCKISRDYYISILIVLPLKFGKIRKTIYIEHVLGLILARTENSLVPGQRFVEVARSTAFAPD